MIHLKATEACYKVYQICLPYLAMYSYYLVEHHTLDKCFTCLVSQWISKLRYKHGLPVLSRGPI